MCTLSFLPRKQGYLLAMNRDERLTREAALPPRVFDLGPCCAIFPHESLGGTWIGANEFGMAFAILNQSVENGGARKIKSRGAIIPKLLAVASTTQLEASLSQLDLRGTLPFKLVAFLPGEKVIREWSWNGIELTGKTHLWQRGHWFSSGLSDEIAARERSATFEKAWKEPRAGTLAWVRRMHRSHRPRRGTFSVCMHRDDARTVSYSEIFLGNQGLELRYRPGPPCGPGRTYTAKLKMRSR